MIGGCRKSFNSRLTRQSEIPEPPGVHGRLENHTGRSRTLQAATDLSRLWPALRYSNCVSGGSSAMVLKDALLAEGGFDQSLQACEDWDMWIRLARKHKLRRGAGAGDNHRGMAGKRERKP